MCKIVCFHFLGCHIVGSNIRSCQLATQSTLCNHDTSVQKDWTARKTVADIVTFSAAEKCSQYDKPELKYAEKLIASLILNRRPLSENFVQKILNFCRKRNDKAYKQKFGDKIYLVIIFT